MPHSKNAAFLMYVISFNFLIIDMALKVPESLRKYDVLGLNDTLNNAEMIKIANENRIERPPDGKIFPNKWLNFLIPTLLFGANPKGVTPNSLDNLDRLLSISA